MKTSSWAPYALFIALSLLAGLIGSYFTLPSITTWYASLVHPFWSPPNWVFGPVWTTLYILMGISAGLVWNSKKPGREVVIGVFLFHLLVNTAWSIVFFGLHQTALAFGILAFLWLLVLTLMTLFAPFSRRASLLLVPYLLWVTYAGTLNLGIMLMNP